MDNSAGAVGVLEIGAVGLGVAAVAGITAGAACAAVLGGSANAIGRVLERNQAVHAARAERELNWDATIADVSAQNARIGALQVACAASDGTVQAQETRPDPLVTLPPMLVLGAQTLTELQQWCRETDEMLLVVERQLVAATTSRLLELALRPAPPTKWPPSSTTSVGSRLGFST